MQYNITYRKKDGNWQYIISFKENGKWRQRSKQGFRTRALAKIASDERLDELKKDVKNTSVSEYRDLTFKELVDIYIKHKEIYNEYSTIKTAEFSIKKFTDLNDLKLKEITSSHIQKCIDDMVKEGLKAVTIKTYVVYVKSVFSHAISTHKIIKNNPFDDVTLPQDKTDDRIKALNKHELETLLKRIKNKKFYITTVLASKTGLRASEILGLTWDSIDFKSREITVNKQWKRLKNGKWGLGTVKRKNSNRVIPFSADVSRDLIKYKKNSITDYNNRVILYANTPNFSKEAIRHFKKAQFDITLHDLRHTYATLLIANGIDFKTVAKLLGHDVEMTMRVYTHVNDDMMDNATNTINNIF